MGGEAQARGLARSSRQQAQQRDTELAQARAALDQARLTGELAALQRQL